MKKRDGAEQSSILEAVDNLSSMAELNLDELRAEQHEKESLSHVQTSHWLDLKNQEKTINSVKDTFKTVHNYLRYVYKKEGSQIKDREVQEGIKSIMALAMEAAQNVDQCVQLFDNKESVKDSREYRELIDFYENKLLKRFNEVLQSEEEWEEEWSREGDAADIQRRGLKDLETVTRDKDYELFYILKEDGSRFYNKNLVRHIRLVADFDQIIHAMTGEDPFLRVKRIQDKIAHEEAIYIRHHIKGELDHWIKKAGKFRENYLVQLFYRSVMALLLAANPRNLLMHHVGKGAISYFRDFQLYLRAVLESVDYDELINSGPGDPFFEEMLELVHKICFYSYMRPVNYADANSLLIRVLGRDRKKGVTTASLSLWNQVMDDYEALYSELKKYPSGPLFKVLDILHEGDEREGFDPYLQEDRPSLLGEVSYGKSKWKILFGAAPVQQRQINKARIIKEFIGCLRHAKKEQKRILLVNLQDRTSWKEFARCQVLEEFQKQAEVKECFDVITMPKDTEFYLQADEYLRISLAKEFKKIFYEQIKSEEGCGFSFPKEYTREGFLPWVQTCIEWIHKRFFGSKEELSRKNRLDFIEIMYNALMIYFMQVSKADTIFITGKDSVDHAAVTAAGFYGCIKLLSSGSDWKEDERERFVNTIFLPAFLIRERPVDIRTINRSISMLSIVSGEIEVHRSDLKKELNALTLFQ